MSAFWAGRRVLVTGHTGFKGSWLSLWLKERGALVTGLALAPATEPSLFVAARVADGMTSILGDVRRLDPLRGAMRAAAPEVVFHLAAQSLVRPSYEDPVGTFDTNVMGTVHTLEAVRQTPSVRAVVVVTSDKCYENREWVWGYRETEPMGGHDPYSSSKGCAELVTASYRSSFFQSRGPAVATARAGNVIGGGDWARDRLIPDLLGAFSKGVPAQIRNPRSIRPWQHVLEPLAGYMQLAERLCSDRDHAEAWNFGPDDDGTETVGYVADTAAELWGDGARWESPQDAQPHEARALRVDSSKSRSRLGWRPRLPLTQALSFTVDWYRAFAAGGDVRELTLSQIRQYETRR